MCARAAPRKKCLVTRRSNGSGGRRFEIATVEREKEKRKKEERERKKKERRKREREIERKKERKNPDEIIRLQHS